MREGNRDAGESVPPAAPRETGRNQGPFPTRGPWQSLRWLHEQELTVVLAPSEAGGACEGTVEVFTARGRDEGDELSCGKRACSDQEAYEGAPTEDRTDLECQAEAVASARVEQHTQDDQLELRLIYLV